ncbi:MAG: patatin-like phospholipase family protein [Oscillospiraceae bacterium]|nr:patatin-like phospholipase family protein [Oscillospiraceae bacterium]
MKLNNKLIGLALSGGGIRATVFHLGVLKYLAHERLFDRIVSISSVSGASLCIGAIFAVNNNKWCTGDEFLSRVLPRVREVILSNDIEKSALRRLPFSPAYWSNRVEIIADMLEKKWGISGTLQDLPRFPYWEINCTTYETGRSFRIRRDYMGDRLLGYTQNPDLPISRMMAASAGFPVLIGPYTLKTRAMRWTKDKHGKDEEVILDPQITLWDGGVYDNLGLEALYKIGKGLDSEIDFLIASDASPPIEYQKRKGSMSFTNMKRLLDIAMYQVGALRRRDFMAQVVKKGSGLYVKIGNCDYPTTLITPSAANFNMLLKCGFESAEAAYNFKDISI